MRIRFSSAAAAAVVAAALLPAAAAAAPVTVNVRIEGATSTIFDGQVTTDAKTLTKDATGPHPCDGTNGGANPTPGPTMTGALDDAAIAGGFTWDGTWFSFGDFGIDRIGPDANDVANNKFWGYALNFVPSQVGGCQQQVHAGDQVLFAYDFFSKAHVLKLTGPAGAAPGQPFTVHVVDGQANPATPVAGASVGGATTDANGDATVTLTAVGDNVLKATKDDSVRSNALHVAVTAPGTPPPGGGGSSGADRTPPVAAIAGIARHQRFARGRGPRVLKGTASDAGGLRDVQLRLAHRRGGRCDAFSDRSARFVRAKCGVANAKPFSVGAKTSWSYLLPSRLGPGNYVLEVTATDAAGNATSRHVLFAVRSRR
jgi:hypothetical protein